MNPLQELIRRRMAERDWSYADIARRGSLPRSTVHHLATNLRPARPPHPQTVTRLAEGLELPAAQVRSAAARAAGYEAYEAAGYVAAEYAPTAFGTAGFEPEAFGSAAGAGYDAAAGYDADDLELRGLVASLGRLSREDRRRVALLVRSLLERREASAEGRSPVRRP